VETRRTVLKKHGSLDESEILEDLAIISAHEDPSNFEYDIAERKRVGDRIAAKVKVSHSLLESSRNPQKAIRRLLT